jgi:hypothetical protein
MMEIQIIAPLSRHRGKYGFIVRANATGSFTVEMANGDYRTFQPYEVRKTMRLS